LYSTKSVGPAPGFAFEDTGYAAKVAVIHEISAKIQAI
jgi:hypothetical protein